MKASQHYSMFPKLSKSTLVLSLKIATVLVSALVIFYQDLAIVAVDALHSEFMSHILAIPFLLVYLIYRKRKMIRAAITFESELSKEAVRRPEIVGALLVLIAFLLYSYGSYTFTPLEHHMFALPIFITACILISFNTQTLRQLAFPIAFLFFLVPPPSEIIYAFGTTLSEVSTHGSCAIMNLFGFATTISTEFGNPIILIARPNGTTLSFMIDIACSGVYSLIGFLIFATFIIYIARGKTWKRAITFIVGFPLIYLLNILRIITIVLLGYYHSMELAMNVFHLLGGWVLIFFGTLLLLAVSEKILRIQLFTKKNVVLCRAHESPKENFCQTCGRLLRHVDAKLKKRDLTAIFALIMSAILIVAIQAPVFALTKGPADVLTQIEAGQKPTTEILPQMREYTLRFLYRDKRFEEIAKQDASLAYAYLPFDSSRYAIWVALEIASARSSLHHWESCIVTSPTVHGRELMAVQLDSRDVHLTENPPIIARYFVFQYIESNLTQAVLYWFETATFLTNSTSQQKYVKISLVAYPVETEDLQEVEAQLLTLGTATASHWQPLKMWLPIALLISRNGNYLATIPAIALGCVLMLNFVNSKSKRKANRKALKKLSTYDQQVVEAVHQTQKRTIPNTNNIASTFRILNGKDVEALELIPILSSLEQVGIIEKQIVNQQDEPILVWKTEL